MKPPKEELATLQFLSIFFFRVNISYQMWILQLTVLNSLHTVRNLHFCPKFNFDFPRKIVELFWVKTRENAAVLEFLAVDNFDFTRKLSKKNWVKNS